MAQVCSVREIADPNLGIITSAALVDSINPCAIAVLLILLATLFMSGRKDKVLKTGFYFILGLFLTYFLFGLGLFSTLKLFQFAKYFHWGVGIFTIFVGLFELKTAIWPPKEAKKVCIGGICTEDSYASRVIGRITTPLTALLAGAVISFIELPCTGGPYFFTLGYLAQNCTWSKIIPILLYYNIIFVLPLVAVTWIIYKGYSSVEKTHKIKQKYLNVINGVAGFVMIALGLWLLFIG